MNLEYLRHGKALCGKVFRRFVETFNFHNDFISNLKGDADLPVVGGRIKLDRADERHPVIRCTLCGGGGGGGGGETEGYTYWSFTPPDEGDETSKACWHNCRLQIGYDASHACTGDSLKQYADGIYYCEVDLLNETCELKRVDGDDKSAIPPHDFEHSKVNLFVGIVKDKKQTFSINCIPVAYKYV